MGKRVVKKNRFETEMTPGGAIQIGEQMFEVKTISRKGKMVLQYVGTVEDFTIPDEEIQRVREILEQEWAVYKEACHLVEIGWTYKPAHMVNGFIF